MVKLTKSLKVLSMLMFAILFVNMVSAFEFDNVKQYDPITKTATIKNTFGLGEDLATITLDTPQVFRVGAGYGKVAQFTIESVESYKNFYQEMKFYDIKKDNKEIARNFDLKYLTYEYIQVPSTYKEVCTTLKNETKICNRVIDTYKLEQKEVWNNFNVSSGVPKGKITIGVFTDVQVGDHVEWIPKLYGVKINEWATWTEGLSADLVSYWDFDENTGLVVEDKENHVHNGTMASGQMGIWFDGGKLNSALRFNGNSSMGVEGSTMAYSDTGFSISGWYNLSECDYSSGFSILEEYEIRTDTDCVWYCDLNNGGVQASADPVSTNVYHLVTCVFDYTNNNLSIWVDGAYNKSANQNQQVDNSAGAFWIGSRGGSGFDTNGSVDELGVWNRTLTQDEITQLYNGGSGITYINNFNPPPQVSLNTPIEDYNSTISEIIFNATITDNAQVYNVSLYLDGSLNETNTSNFNGTYLFTKSFADGDHNWQIIAYDNDTVNNINISEIRNLTVDTTPPIVNDAQNITDLLAYSLPISSVWNYTATDVHIDSCYYNTTEDPTITVITCNASETTAWASAGNKTIQYCANDTLGWETCKTAWVNVVEINYTQSDDPDPVGEGTNVTFDLNISMDSIPSTTATLMFNESFYTYDSTSCTVDYCYFNKTITIPDGYGSTTGLTQPYYWNYTIEGIGTNASTSTTNVTVYALAVDDCSVYGDVILNMTLNDEEGNNEVNGSLGSNIEIDLMLTSKINSSLSWTFNNTWVNDSNVAVCIPSNILNNSEYWIDFTVGFDSTDRVWEFYYLDDGTLNSTKVFDAQTDYTINLMDLATADSTSFLFNYFDQDGLPVDDAIVHVFRKYIGDGTFYEVERSKADQNGDTIVHLVEEDVIYYFLISQYGLPLYTSSNYNALCQATPCTIQIEASGGFATFPTDYDLVYGGAVAINSSASTRTVSLTYALNHTADMNFTIYKYNSDGSYTPINSSAETGSSGVITMTVPMSAGNVSFFGNIRKDDQFIKAEWIDFEANATDTFGTTLSIFIAVLIILTLGLIAVTEGAGTIIMVLLGIFLSGALGLLTTRLNTGVNILIYLICAGGLILWKITSGRRG